MSPDVVQVVGSGQYPGDPRSIVGLTLTSLATIQKNNDYPTGLNEKLEISPIVLVFQQSSVMRDN
jgi:hypothetical protein